MRWMVRRPGFVYGGLACVSALAAILVLAAFSRSHSPLEYMVAGTLATTVALAAFFAALVRRKRL